MTQDDMILYDQLVELEIATAEEINLVRCCMEGSWDMILKAILFARTSCRTLEQYYDELDEE